MGKNNVSLVCIPNPPMEAKAKDSTSPTMLLMRVKTGEEADEICDKLNEYKKWSDYKLVDYGHGAKISLAEFSFASETWNQTSFIYVLISINIDILDAHRNNCAVIKMYMIYSLHSKKIYEGFEDPITFIHLLKCDRSIKWHSDQLDHLITFPSSSDILWHSIVG